jgi:hypothetical protein
MLLPDAGFGEISGEQAHFERQEKALLSAHRALNLQLDDPRRGTCISEGHAQNVTTYIRLESPWLR